MFRSSRDDSSFESGLHHTRSGRETRLLILVMVVAFALLVVLSRFRYPGANLAVVAPTPGPLAGLAARAAFEDMASSLSTLLSRVGPAFFVVPLGPEPPPAPPSRGTPPRQTARGRAASRPAEAEAETVPVPIRLAAAFRMQPDLALVHVPSGWVPQLDVLQGTTLVALDPARELALLRTGPVNDLPGRFGPNPFPGFGYVGAVDVTANGPTIQPLFIGRAEAVTDARWPAPLLDLGRVGQPVAGSWLFSMDARLVGLVIGRANGALMVPADALAAAVQDLNSRRPPQ
jgi:hypothetical protein